MSLINRTHLSYLRCVEQYFLSLTEKGLSLSPIDYQIIDSWKARGIPLSIACSGIKTAITTYNRNYGSFTSPPKSIRYCEGLVEKEFANHKRLKVGSHFRQEEPADDKKALLRRIDKLIDKIDAIIIREKDEKLRRLYVRVRRRVQGLRSDIDKKHLYIYAELEKIDKSFLSEFCNRMSPEALTLIVEETKEKLSSHRHRMTHEAYERTSESLRNRLVRKRYRLLSIDIGD